MRDTILTLEDQRQMCIRDRVLVVCGDKDKINKKASLELQQQIENAEIAIIENGGHEVNTDNPTLLGQKLNIFFKQYV